MADLQSARIAPPSQGLDTVASPDYVRPGFAAVMENFLPGRPGKAVLRGRLKRCTPEVYATASAHSVGQIWVHDASALSDFATGGAAWKTVNTTTGAVTAGTGPASSTPGPWARLGDNVFGVAVGSSMYKWTGGTSNAAAVTNGPFKAAGVAAHLDRLFALGGSAPGTSTPVFTNRLWWTDQLGPVANTLAEWQDDVSGLVNQLTVPCAGDDFGVTVASIPRGLVIFMRNSTWLLTGGTPGAFQLRRMLTTGCVDAGSVLPVADGVYFLSDDGYQFFDGAVLQDVSGRVRPDLLAAANLYGYPLLPVYNTTSPVVRVSAARLQDDSIMLTIAAATGATVPFSAVFHRPSGSWWSFSSPAMDYGISGVTGPGAGGLARMSGSTWAWDQRRLWRIDPVTLPEVDLVAADVGLNQSAGTEVSATAYVGRIDSRVVPLATPQYKSQMHRVMADYRVETAASGPSADGHLRLTILQGNASALVPAQELLAGTGRQRLVVQGFNEADEAFARLELVSTDDAPLAKVEVYDVWLEFQVSRQK